MSAVDSYQYIEHINACQEYSAGNVGLQLRSRHFLSQKLWHFLKNTRSCVKMNAIAHAKLTFQISTLLKKYQSYLFIVESVKTTSI